MTYFLTTPKINGRDIKTVVGAWATGSGISLGQIDVDGKSNEITAVPVLLDVLDLKGCIVTADAMGCQRYIAAGIVAAGADYILSLKGNQGKLHEQVAAFLDGMIADGLETYSTEDHGRGRLHENSRSSFGRSASRSGSFTA
jgi:predicted transposase YbfD/YdcC